MRSASLRLGGKKMDEKKRRRIPLGVSEGTLTSIKKRAQVDGVWRDVRGYPFVNAKGYNKINQVAGVMLVTPPEVAVDGVYRANPHYTIDARGSIGTVIIRRIAIHRSDGGAVNAREHTCVYDPLRYLVEDLQNVASRDPNSVHGGVLPPGEAPPAGYMFFAQYQDEALGGIGLFAKGGSKPVMKALRSYSERRKKALQIAQTHCDRDLLRKVLGEEIEELTEEGDAIFVVRVHDIDAMGALDRERVLGLATADTDAIESMVDNVEIDDSDPTELLPHEEEEDRHV